MLLARATCLLWEGPSIYIVIFQPFVQVVHRL